MKPLARSNTVLAQIDDNDVEMDIGDSGRARVIPVMT